MAFHKRINFINFSRKLTVNSLFFLMPLYFLDLGYSGGQIGVILSFFALAPLLFSFPTGWINDRLSMKKVIQIALFCLVVIFILIAQTENFWVMAGLFLLLGLANNALDISTNSLYYKDDTPQDMNRKYGIYVFWLSLGVATGTLIGGIVMDILQFKAMFYLFAAFSAVVFVAARDIGKERFDIVTIKEYRLSLLNKKTLLFSLLIFVMTLHWGAEGTVYSPFLRRYLKLDDLQLALYIAIPLFVLALSARFIGLLRYDTRTNRRIFLTAMALSGLGHVLMVNSHVGISFAFRVMHEIGDGFMGALIVLYISRLFERRSIGGSSGVLLSVMTFGHVVGAVVFSLLGFRMGLHYPFLVSGLLLIANTVFGYFLFKKIKY